MSITKQKQLDQWRHQKLMNCFASVATYKGVIEIVNLPLVRVPTSKSQELRRQFKREGKREFFRWMAQNKPDNLIKIGYTPKDIDIIQNTGLLHVGIKQTKQAREYNVDHITSLRWGGTNDIKNLCLMPKTLNSLKEKIESLQHGLLKDEPPVIKTLVPAQINGQRIKLIPEQRNAL